MKEWMKDQTINQDADLRRKQRGASERSKVSGQVDRRTDRCDIQTHPQRYHGASKYGLLR
jgi:hypothetical protein